MITVLYTCKACKTIKQPVQVRFRFDNEAVTHYVGQTVGEAVGKDHKARSPHCRARTMTNVMIPMKEGYPIGYNPDLPPPKEPDAPPG